MSWFRNLAQVFPRGNSGWPRRLLLWVPAIVVAAVVVVVGAYYLDVATESDEFCGLLCHANRPQYVAHQVSAHAEVECGTCHIGRARSTWRNVSAVHWAAIEAGARPIG